MNHGHDLLAFVVVALNRVVVHGHDKEATLLPHLQYVCVVNRVCQQRLVCQAVDEELVVQRDEEVLLVPPTRHQIYALVEGYICDFNR